MERDQRPPAPVILLSRSSKHWQQELTPETHRARESWERSAAAVEAYRIEYGVDDEHSDLGARPQDPGQLIAWREAARGGDVNRDRGASR